MGNFTNEEIKLAKQVQDTYNVPASVVLSQYALESGYGKSTVGANNYFNIKGSGNGGYKDYTSKEESFMDFGRLLSTDRYTSKTSGASNVSEYVQGVKDGGYAEDPNYVSKVMSIIKSNNLTQYDTTAFGGAGAQRDLETGEIKEFANKSESGEIYHTANYDLTWWGDVVIVVFAILLIIAGVFALAMAVVGGSPKKAVKKAVAKKVGGLEVVEDLQGTLQTETVTINGKAIKV